jgi:Domain of unknown function (DUF5618)
METIVEAMRYIENAKTILSEKARKENGIYQDKKYVRMAGHRAYLGVLVALDGLLGTKKKGRKSVEWYKSELAKTDKKIVGFFDIVYDTLHLSLSYDGNADAEIAKTGLKRAEQIISWVGTKLT